MHGRAIIARAGSPKTFFAGDPNDGGGPTPVVGQLLVDTVGGGVYQAVQGGLFDRTSGADIVNSSTAGGIVFNPNTDSFTFLYKTRIERNTTSAYALHGNRLNGVGLTVAVNTSANVTVVLRKSPTEALECILPNLFGKSVNLAVTFDHVTQTLKVQASGYQREVSGVYITVSSATSSAQSLTCDQNGSHFTPFFAGIPRTLTDTELDNWCDEFICPSCGDALQLYDFTRQSYPPNMQNLGLAGGSFNVTDGDPMNFGSALRWVRIA